VHQVSAHSPRALVHTAPTVGELRTAEICVSYMPSLQAKKLEKLRPRSWDRPLGLNELPEKSAHQRRYRLKGGGDLVILSHDNKKARD
jgi:hypothetical protein